MKSVMVRSEGEVNSSGPAVNDTGGSRSVQDSVGPLPCTSQILTVNSSPSGSVDRMVALVRM